MNSEALRQTLELTGQVLKDLHELIEGDAVGRRPRVNHHVQRLRVGQEQRSTELAKAPLQAVSVDCRSSVLRYDEPHTRELETRKGSDHSNVEMFCSKSLPRSCNDP
jgi:hypothetical protein